MMGSSNRGIANLVILAVAALLVQPNAVEAKNDREALQRWGIFGTWAADCSKVPARDNVYETFVSRSNDASLDRDGGGFKDSSRILSASLTSDGMIEMFIEFRSISQTRVNVFLKGPDGRKRAFTNHDSKGSYSIRSGRFINGGQESKWMTRCR